MSPSTNELNLKSLRIVMAQLNFCVGDIQKNLEKCMSAAIEARDKLSADMIVFPELSISGYPAEDLLLRDDFLQDVSSAVNRFVTNIRDIYCIISYPLLSAEGLKNVCSLVYNGNIITTYAKMCLPNYGVFDENRYFISGKNPCIVKIKNIPIGILICEDLWFKEPIALACEQGAKLIISINASPFEINKEQMRNNLLIKRAIQHHVPILYTNCIGGQDELIFDGGSVAVDANGNLCQFAGYFKEKLLSVDIHIEDKALSLEKNNLPTALPEEEKIYSALVLSLRDYIEKNRFKGVLIGISGGIDSALVLAIAVDALGHERVQGVMLPSQHTSNVSKEDALEILNNLNVKHQTISIDSTYQTLITTLKPIFKDAPLDKTEENIQARARGIILMALSNKFGSLVLNTGNRSELAVGYCTLYGDMVGGFSVLKDIPKMMVYRLATYRNQISPVIPVRTIEREPTAELAPNQKDQDSLPPYPILDDILHYYLNQGENIETICQRGFPLETVKKVIQLVQNNEYKRRLAAIGPRINHKSFGKDWRYPITNRFKV